MQMQTQPQTQSTRPAAQKKKLPPPPERFKVNLLYLVDHVKDIIVELNDRGHTPLNGFMIDLAKAFLLEYDQNVMIRNFITKSYNKETQWFAIKNKDEDGFLKNANAIFSNLPGTADQYVDLFKELFFKKDDKGNRLVEDDKLDQIWLYLHAMIKVCIHHIHEERHPKIETDPNNPEQKIKKYTQSYFPDISVKTQAEIWNVKIEWPDQ